MSLSSSSDHQGGIRSRFRLILSGILFFIPLLAACTEVPRSTLPPSESDLVLLHRVRLCDLKLSLLQQHGPSSIQREPWGSGEELRIPSATSASKGEESYFFDEDGLLVGVLFVFPNGLPLKPYPVLRKTLSELKPTMEFYLGVMLPGQSDLESSALYMTGDEKTTTQYITQGEGSAANLLLASVSIDPYSTLLSPYRQEFLARMGRGPKGGRGGASSERTGESKEPFLSLQQFARGQTAQLGYCDSRSYERAADAYRKAIQHGFTDKTWLAEAHHRLGLALEGLGQLDRAKAEMQRSLQIRPNSPEVLNNLGTVFSKLGERDQAIAAFERAVTLRPNYPIARYNLAEAYEAVNAKRAISEYETYIALVEGIPAETERIAQAKERVKTLKR